MLKDRVLTYLEPEIVQEIFKGETVDYLWENIYLIARSGNYGLLRYLVVLYKEKQYGVNFLLCDVLTGQFSRSFQKRSVFYKMYDNRKITPLHLACINPDTSVLEHLLKYVDDLNFPDLDNRRPLHYAAACITPGPLRVLLNAGANIKDLDRQKYTPLMVAAQFNRAESCKVLIDAGQDINLMTTQRSTALHFAAMYGNLDALKVLLGHGANVMAKASQSQSALHLAAKFGNFTIVEELLKVGAKVGDKDNRKRTALIPAVKNGWVDVASLLIAYGVPVDEPDSSKNTALHYACAYGWIECVDLLLQYTRDKNPENDWRLTPLLVAMLKGHTGIVNKLLQDPGINVDCKDDNGRTVLSQYVTTISQDTVQSVQMLLDQKRADPNIADLDGKTPLHHLCSLPKPVINQEKLSQNDIDEMVKQQTEIQVDLCKLLLSNGADIELQDNKGITPLFTAILSGNADLADFLIANSADLYKLSKKNQSVLNVILQFDPDMLKIAEMLLSDQKLVDNFINQLDDRGYTPLLSMLENYVEQANEVFENLEQRYQRQAQDVLKQYSGEKLYQAIQDDPRFILPKTEVMLEQKQQQTQKKSEKFYKNITKSVSLNNLEINKETERDYQAILDKFIQCIQQLINAGADISAQVQKLQKYRIDPGKRQREYEHEQFKAELDLQDFKPIDGEYFYLQNGVKVWNEYSENGLNNVIHIAANGRDQQVMRYLTDNLHTILNVQNYLGRTPLHLAVKNGSIHNVKMLCQRGANCNIQDVFGNTALLLDCRASQNYEITKTLLEYSASTDLMNNQGNYPLMEAVLNSNYSKVKALLTAGSNPNIKNLKQRTTLHYAFNKSKTSRNSSFKMENILIQSGADLNVQDKKGRTPVHYAFVKMKQQIDDSSIYDPIETISAACKMDNFDPNIQDIFQRTPLFYAAQHGALTSSMALIQKGADPNIRDCDGNTPLARAIMLQRDDYAVILLNLGASISEVFYNLVHPKVKQGNRMRSFRNRNQRRFGKKPGKYSMFELAIENYREGLAFQLLIKGYPLVVAIWDALKIEQYHIAQTIFAKIDDPQLLHYLHPESQQNLYHYLAKCESKMDKNEFQEMFQQLQDSQLDLNAKDVYGCAPLHYAAQKQNKLMLKAILDQIQDVDVMDNESKTPFITCIENTKNLTPAVSLLVNKGANIDQEYISESETIRPLIHCLQNDCEIELIVFLINNGASISQPTSDGLVPLMYAIKANNTHIITEIIPFLTKEQLNYREPNYSWNALNYVIAPMQGASYENLEIFKLLVQRSVDYKLSDALGKNLYFYAYKQKSWIIKEHLDKLKIQKQISEDETIQPMHLDPIDYEFDAQQYIDQHLQVTVLQQSSRKPDKFGKFGINYQVVDEYDIHLLKIDILRQRWGIYVFYRMQLLHETNRNVYVVFTRWGRIGESGANQRTPFKFKDEAVAEFCKIFKQKTGNEWGQPFKNIQFKYKPMQLIERKAHYNNFIQKFDFNSSPPTNLPEPIFNLLSKVASIKRLEKFTEMNQIDDKILNWSTIGKHVIQEAQDIVSQLLEINEEREQTEDKYRNEELLQQTYELSNKFYELIPFKRYQNTLVPPLDNKYNIIQARQFLINLQHMECAQKMMLGALHCQKTMNPIDYIYNSLGTVVNIINDNVLASIIKKYLSQSQIDPKRLKNIYSVDIPEEREKIKRFANVKERMLFWHGTGLANILSILKQGLRVGLFDYGGMFGSGAYFADTAQKSMNYSYTGINCSYGKENIVMFLCEVVVGKSQELYQPNQDIQKPKTGCLSVKGVGQMGPDRSQSIFLQDGLEVPCGRIIKNEIDENEKFYLNQNEYVVYDQDQIRLRYMVELEPRVY